MKARLRYRKSLLSLRLRRPISAVWFVLIVSSLVIFGSSSHALAAPTFSVDPHGDGIQGTGSDWPTGTPTIIRVYATEGASAPSLETSVSDDARDPVTGDFWQYLGGSSGWDLMAGQRVVVSNGTNTMETVVTQLTVDGVDFATNSVWGHTAPGVGGEIHVYGHDDLNSTFVDPGNTGNWSYNFSSSGGLQQDWQGEVTQTDANGNSTMAEWHVPDPHFVVDPGSAQITGKDWGLRDDVTVTVYDAGSSTPKLTQTSGVDDNWSFIIDSPVTIRAGDRVVATDGYTLTTMTVSPLAITSFNATTGVVGGICTAKSQPPTMGAGIDNVGGSQIFPSAAGSWIAMFDGPPLGLPLPPGTEGWVDELDDSGNWTQARWRVPEMPVAVDHDFAVIEDTTLSDGVLAGASYYGPTLKASFTTPPKHGTVIWTPGMATFDYRPEPGFSGTDTFRYSIADSTPWQTLWSEPATVTVTVRPWYLGYSSFSTTAIQLQWPDTGDMLPNFDHYKITDNGSAVTNTTKTSWVLSDLTSGSSHVFGVSMVDKSGDESLLRTLAVTMPQQASWANVETTEAATAQLVVPAPGSSGGVGEPTAPVTVVMTGVTDAGQLAIVRSDAPPADAPPTLKFVDQYYDLSFTGSFNGTVTVSVPYDPRIPDSRALSLRLQHWTDGAWEDLDTTVDLANHTLTASVTSLSPIVVAEPEDTVTEARIALSIPALQPAFGIPAIVTANLTTNDTAATKLPGFSLALERLSGASWIKVATLSEVAGSPGSYSGIATPDYGIATTFRVRLETNPLYAAPSAAFTVVPAVTQTSITNLRVSPSRPKKGKYATFSAILSPGAAALTAPTTITLSRKETKTVIKKVGRKKKKVKVTYWHVRKTITMSASASGALSAKYKLPYSGSWQAVVRYPGSSGYAQSTATKTFTVK